jgi:hypothetical protein
MELVVNKCYGGFGLSERAILKYCELKGWKVFPEEIHGSLGITNYWLVPKDERVKELENWHESSLEERQKYNETYSKQCLYDRDIARDDKELIAVVKELGEAASNKYANLKIVEIPDDVKWVITEYDGLESVDEVHRSW